MVPEVVIGPPVRPVPVLTSVRVPPDGTALIVPLEVTVMVVPSTLTPPRVDVVAGKREIVPVLVIGPPDKPSPVSTSVTPVSNGIEVAK
jgi:hypothetical protein